MSKFSDNISTIHNNVFSLTPIFVSFYKNLKEKDYDMLLSYFILPIVLHPVCLDEIAELRSNSKLTRIVSNKTYMAGFQDNFEYYKQVTNNCMQYAIDCGYLKVEDKLKIKVINDDIRYVDTSLKRSIELASKLHNIFTLDVVHTYVVFGIKGL